METRATSLPCELITPTDRDLDAAEEVGGNRTLPNLTMSGVIVASEWTPMTNSEKEVAAAAAAKRRGRSLSNSSVRSSGSSMIGSREEMENGC